MDYTDILALISALTGQASDDFADLKAGENGRQPISQIVCPRPLPADEIEGKTVFCGSVQVPEDHAKPDGKKITLEFAILKSHSLYAESDPVVYLQGGPGGSSIDRIPLLAQTFEPFRKTRHVVFWDQRSAGLSGQKAMGQRLPTICPKASTSAEEIDSMAKMLGWFDQTVGFSNGCAALTLKKPPPLVAELLDRFLGGDRPKRNRLVGAFERGGRDRGIEQPERARRKPPP